MGRERPAAGFHRDSCPRSWLNGAGAGAEVPVTYGIPKAMVGSSQRARRPGLRTRVNGTIAIARDAIPWAIRFGGSHGRGDVVVLGEDAAGCASGAFFADSGQARSVESGGEN